MGADLEFDGLPGADLVRAGVRDLRSGDRTVPALLVNLASTRLQAAGVDVPGGVATAERPSHALYGLLAESDPRTAHGRYNALVRRIVSFARAAERANSRRAAQIELDRRVAATREKVETAE
jgi:hypothetical protein